MQRTDLIRLARTITKPLGYRHKSNRFWKIVSDLTIVFDFQRSQWSSDVYVNFGVIPTVWLVNSEAPPCGYWMLQRRASDPELPHHDLFTRLESANDGSIPPTLIEHAIHALVSWFEEHLSTPAALRSILQLDGSQMLHSGAIEDWTRGTLKDMSAYFPPWPPVKKRKLSKTEKSALRSRRVDRAKQVTQIIAPHFVSLGFSKRGSLLWKVGTDICACVLIEPDQIEPGISISLRLAEGSNLSPTSRPVWHNWRLYMPATGVPGLDPGPIASLLQDPNVPLRGEDLSEAFRSLALWVDTNMTSLVAARMAGLDPFPIAPDGIYSTGAVVLSEPKGPEVDPEPFKSLRDRDS